MSSPHEQSDAVADKAMEAALDSLMLLHRQAFNSVMVLDREQRKDTAEQQKNGLAALLQEAADKTYVEAALNSVMVLHREALNVILKKNRYEQRKKQQNNEIIDLKKELVELKRKEIELLLLKKGDDAIITQPI